FPDEIYVFTPKGKIMALPRGATAVDFAYAVHTDIGHHCTAARINYELMPLRTELKSGDQVEIITAPAARPNPSWLSFVATGKALTRVATRAPDDAPQGPPRAGALQLRGVEGVAIQYGKCCRPIPGDAIVGQFRRGQGLLVHTRDCQTLRKGRVESDQIVDVEWAPKVEGVFEAGIRIMVDDQRGLLARLATAIADAGANIEYVSMERPDTDRVVNM